MRRRAGERLARLIEGLLGADPGQVWPAYGCFRAAGGGPRQGSVKRQLAGEGLLIDADCGRTAGGLAFGGNSPQLLAATAQSNSKGHDFGRVLSAPAVTALATATVDFERLPAGINPLEALLGGAGRPQDQQGDEGAYQPGYPK